MTELFTDTVSLGSLRRTVNHSLNVACRGDFLRFSSLLSLIHIFLRPLVYRGCMTVVFRSFGRYMSR